MMITTRRALATVVATLSLVSAVIAQSQAPNSQATVPIVTATASHQRVRYVAMGEVQQTRLQVFAGEAHKSMILISS